MANDDTITTNIRNAPTLAKWISERGGVAQWYSIDLSDPGYRALSPALDKDGNPYPKPSWKVDSRPMLVVTDPAKIVLALDVEVRRFHVAVRVGGSGLKFKLTDASSDRVRRAVAKAGEGAYYGFDYGTQEAVIWKPESTMTLAEWMAAARGGEDRVLSMLEEQ